MTMKFFNKSFPFYKQFDSQDCGFTCIRIISKYYDVEINSDNDFFSEGNVSKQGISIRNLSKTAEDIGYDSLIVKLDYEKALENIKRPAIFYWNQNHFIVVYKITTNKIYVSDPAFGKTTYSKKEFNNSWAKNNGEGVVVLLEPTEKLFKNNLKTEKGKNSIGYIAQYIRKHKPHFILIAITLLISSFVELLFPFFTQKIIDRGVSFKDISFIYLILGAQIIMFLSRISLEFYRAWLFIHISSRISINVISDFLRKLMKLPLKFFNSKNIGDITQRIYDHKRVEEFLSKDLIQSIFSIFSIVIYLIVLLYFNTNIFFIVLIFTALELIWIFAFLNKIRILDHKTFSLETKDQNKIFELIIAMQEIKLNNLENDKREEWQNIQSSIYQNNIQKLKVNQQYESYRFFSFFQNILVIFSASLAVINENLTLGSMLAIMFILGGLSGPISQLINFILQYQLTRISFERLNEIHNKPDESNGNCKKELSSIKDIFINNLTFSYDNTNNVLQDISINIPKGKTTAIVGVSGSGKTSLIKLLLKFNKPQKGSISIGEIDINDVDNVLWRSKCGVILQDSHIFSGSISYNISLSETPDIKKLQTAIKLSNIEDFIINSPLQLDTFIGSEGIGVSQGQKQRILIARAIYKNPDYLFFDEATNSLDAKNERIIVENINDYFNNKTMIVVAHRLSTVKNADQILVMSNGKIIEKGNHVELINKKGEYYDLIQNQLELGL